MSAAAKAALVLGTAHNLLKTARNAETDYRFVKRLFSRRDARRRTTPIMPKMSRKRMARRGRTGRVKRRKYSKLGRVKTKRQIPSSNYLKKRRTRKPRPNPRSELNTLLGPIPHYQSRVKKSLSEAANFNTINQNTLYSTALIKISHDPDEDNMQTRHGNSCLIRGVKMTYKFSVNLDYTGQPLRFHWAIVANKVVNTPVNSVTELPTTNWWEHVAPTFLNNTGMDFTTGDSCIKYEKRRINPMHYLVLKRGSFTLENNRPFVVLDPVTPSAPILNNNATGSENKASRFKSISAYIPLNTQMRFNDITVTFPTERNLYMCWWCYPMDKVAGNVDQSAVAQVLRYQMTYFEDSQT